MEPSKPISADTAAAISSHLAEQDKRPTAQRQRMIAQAHTAIADITDDMRTVEAALSVLLDKQNEAFRAADEGDLGDINDLRKRIDEINMRRTERRTAHDRAIAAANENTKAELTALKDMLAAQHAVLETLEPFTPMTAQVVPARRVKK